MSKEAIVVEGLGKRYWIGHRKKHDRLGELVSDVLKSPFRKAFGLLRGHQHAAASLNEELWALRDVSFSVDEGEVVGLIGRNGSGKSTLLKILSRITDPTEGGARLYGRVGSLLEVGTGFHPELTGRENTYLNGSILGLKKEEIDGRFDQIVDFSEIGKFIDTPVKHYSSGMHTRLAFAVAAHLEPEILLVDEVLAVGDVAFQKKCLGKMRDVSGEGRTVIFVSHNMGLISELCSRCLLLEDGNLVEEGASGRVIRRYLAEQAPDSHVDLETWEGERRGKGPVRLTHMTILDGEGRRRAMFQYDEPLVMDVGLSAPKPTTCALNVSVRNEMGHLILHLNNMDYGVPVELAEGNNEVRVEIPRNVLNDGRYFIRLGVFSDLNHLYDSVDSCLSFEVESSAEGNIRSQAPVRVPAEWSVSNSVPAQERL